VGAPLVAVLAVGLAGPVVLTWQYEEWQG